MREKTRKIFILLLLAFVLSLFFTVFTATLNNFNVKAESNDVIITFEGATASDIVEVKRYDNVTKEFKTDEIVFDNDKIKLNSEHRYFIKPKQGYALFGYTYEVGSEKHKANENNKTKLDEVQVDEESNLKSYKLIKFTGGSYNAVFSDKIYVDIVADNELVTSIKEGTNEEKTLKSVSKDLLTTPSIYLINQQSEINLVLNKGVKVIYTDNYLKTKIVNRIQNRIKNIYTDDSSWSTTVGSDYSFDNIEFQIGNIEDESELVLDSSPYFIFEKLFKNQFNENPSLNKLGKTKITLRKNVTINPEESTLKRDLFLFKDFGEVEFSKIENLKITSYFLIDAKSTNVDNRTMIKMPSFNISTVIDSSNTDQDKVNAGDLFILEGSSLFLGSNVEKSNFLIDRISTKIFTVDGTAFIDIDQKSAVVIDNVSVEVTKLAKESITISKPFVKQTNIISKIELDKLKQNNENLVKIVFKNFTIKYEKTAEDASNPNYKEVSFLLLKTECANIVDLDFVDQNDTIKLDVNASKIDVKNINKASNFIINLNDLTDQAYLKIENVKFDNNYAQSALLDLTNNTTQVVNLDILGDTTFTSYNNFAILVRNNIKVNFYNILTNILTEDAGSSIKFYGLKNSENKYQIIEKEAQMYLQPYLLNNQSVYWHNGDKKIYEGEMLLKLNSDKIDAIVSDKVNYFTPHYEVVKEIQLNILDKEKLNIPFWSKINHTSLLRYGTDWQTANNVTLNDNYYLGPLNDPEINFMPYKVGLETGKGIFNETIRSIDLKKFSLAVYMKDGDTGNYIKMRNILITSGSFDSNKYKVTKRKLKIRQTQAIILYVGKNTNIYLIRDYFNIYNGDKTEIDYDEILDSEASDEQKINKAKLFEKYPDLANIEIETDIPSVNLKVGEYDLSLNNLNSQNINIEFVFDQVSYDPNKTSGKLKVIESDIELSNNDYIFIEYSLEMSNKTLDEILFSSFETFEEDGKTKLKLSNGRPIPITSIVKTSYIVSGKEYSGKVYLAYLLYEEKGEWKLHELNKNYKQEGGESEVIASKYFYKAGEYTLTPQSNEGFRFKGLNNLKITINKKHFTYSLALPTYRYQNLNEYRNTDFIIQQIMENNHYAGVEANVGLENSDEIIEIIKKPKEYYKLDRQSVDLKLTITTVFDSKEAGKNKTAQVRVLLIGDNASNFEMTIKFNSQTYKGNSITIDTVENLSIEKTDVNVKINHNDILNNITIDFAIQLFDSIKKDKNGLPYRYAINDPKYNVFETLTAINNILRVINVLEDYKVEGSYGDFVINQLEFAFRNSSDNELAYLNGIDLNNKETFIEEKMNHIINSKTYLKAIIISNQDEIRKLNPNYNVKFENSFIDLVVNKAKIKVRLNDITPYYIETHKPIPKYEENGYALNFNELFTAKIEDQEGNTPSTYNINTLYTVKLESNNPNYEPKDKILGFKVTQTIVSYKFKNINLKPDDFISVNLEETSKENLLNKIREKIVFIDQFGNEIKTDKNTNLQLFKESLKIEEGYKMSIEDNLNYLNASFVLPIKINLSILNNTNKDNFNFTEKTVYKQEVGTNEFANFIKVKVNIALDSYKSLDNKLVIEERLINTEKASSSVKWNLITKETNPNDYEETMKSLTTAMRNNMKKKVSNNVYKNKKFRATASFTATFDEKIFAHTPQKMSINVGKTLNKDSVILYIDTATYGTPNYKILQINKDYTINNGVLTIKNTDKINNSLSGQYVIGTEKSNATVPVVIIIVLIVLAAAITTTVLLIKKKKTSKK